MLTNKIKTLDIKVKRNIDSLFLGTYKTFFKGRGLEFSDFREYEPGDDVKTIDWIVSAREGKTFTRLYREERELSVNFLLDLSSSMKFGLGEKTKRDSLEELFFILSYSRVKNGDKVGAILKDKNKFVYLNAKKGRDNIFSIASKIEENQELGNPFSIDESILFLNNLKIKNNLVFIVTDKLDFDERLFKIASLKNEIIFIHIFDDFENTLLGLDGIINFVGDDGKNIIINLNDKKKIKEYLSYRFEKLENFRKKLAKLNIKYLKIDNKTNIYKELYKMFNK
ncbi:MAG: DUF58 domain-containing protein [Candidatus Gracilibacteria bacterium]|nr:DUF58 domain-containing protein [Candidatus Gracilibacteria bacterium]